MFKTIIIVILACGCGLMMDMIELSLIIPLFQFVRTALFVISVIAACVYKYWDLISDLFNEAYTSIGFAFVSLAANLVFSACLTVLANTFKAVETSARNKPENSWISRIYRSFFPVDEYTDLKKRFDTFMKRYNQKPKDQHNPRSEPLIDQ